MTFTYNLANLTDTRSRVRLLLRDTDPDNVIFQDEELDAFLAMNSSNLFRTAALAYEAIAGNEAYVQKVMKLLDVQTDGAKVADSLRAQAARWRAQADEEELDAGGVFDWAEMVLNPAGLREHLHNDVLRGGL